MGWDIPPAPGSYLTQNKCDFCSQAPHPLWEPGQAPQKILVQIYENSALLAQQVVSYLPGSVCWWEYQDAPTFIDWKHEEDPFEYSLLNWLIHADPHDWFFSGSSWIPCQTHFTNQKVPPERWGDYGIISWGAEIDAM